VLLSAACLIVSTLVGPWAAGAEDPLWHAYASGPESRATVLRQCSERLERLRVRAAALGPRTDWSADEDVRWLLGHRIPAVLVIERELDGDPEDGYLTALVWTAQRLGHRRLLSKLPQTLWMADGAAARLALLDVLGRVGTAGAVSALEEFLETATVLTDEQLICAAAAGLGRTRDERHLSLLRSSERLVRTPLAELQFAAARWQCGDQAMEARLLAVLRAPGAGPAEMQFVLTFLAENPMEDALPDLARLATEAQDEGVMRLALKALVETTGYNRPPDKTLIEPWPGDDMEPAAAEEAQEADPLLADPTEMTQQEREELVEQILQHWRERPLGGPAGAGQSHEPPPS